MTINELIEKLNKFNGEMKVTVFNIAGELEEATLVVTTNTVFIRNDTRQMSKKQDVVTFIADSDD